MSLTVEINPNSVTEVKGGGYAVASKSHPGYFAFVWGNECSCLATGPSCRHRKLVATYVKAQDDARRPARRPVNVALLVD
jgi:hypothetical protein